MAYIVPRRRRGGRVAYQARVRIRGHSEVATFDRRSDAVQWAGEREAAIRAGRIQMAAGRGRTVADAIDRYLEDVAPQRPKSAPKTAALLEWWRDQLGDTLLADLTPAILSEYRDRLFRGNTYRKKKRSPSTVNRYTAALGAVLNIAAREWEWIPGSPMARLKKLREPRGRVRYLSKGETGALLAACKKSTDKRLYLAVVLLLSTGARLSEIALLRWPQVDFRQRRIDLDETKNDERRALPLTGLAHRLLREAFAVRRLDTDRVFPVRRGGAEPKFQRAWTLALERAGIEDFRIHDLRHTAASYLAMNGATPGEIAAVLGHKTLAMVKRYAHLSEAHTHGVVERMNEAMFPTGAREESG